MTVQWCPSCGAGPHGSDVRFCENCGEPLSVAEPDLDLPLDSAREGAEPGAAPPAEDRWSDAELHPAVEAHPVVSSPVGPEEPEAGDAAGRGDTADRVDAAEPADTADRGDTTEPADTADRGDTTEPVDPAGEGGVPARPWRRRILAVAGVMLTVLGLVGIGVAIGWRLVAHQDPAVAGTRFVKVEIPDYESGSTARMPDVRGLPEDAARATLADAGIPIDVVQVSERGAAGQPGVVIEQAPAFGTEQPAAVELVISTKATVPDVIGSDEDDAYARLRELGPIVEIKRVYRPGVEPGVAVAVDPPVGKRLGDSVELFVSEAAASVFLSELDSVDGSCSSGAEDVDGTEYANSLSCGARYEMSAAAWVIGRRVDELNAIVGVPDDGPADARVQVVVFADGKKVKTARASYGSPVAVRATLTGALRMEIRFRALNADEDSWGTSATVVLADARLSGSSAAIDELVASN